MTDPLRLGTRASELARTQSGHVADRVRELTGREVELVTISTEGDRSSAPLDQIGGTGVFVAALRDALVAGEVDFAVHSLKDLPTADDPRLVLAAVPPREDVRDALVARDGLTLGELPPGSRIGTGSPRRAAQINALGLGVEVVPIRGNVDTRLGKVRSGEVDAVVLARAGLVRLGRADEATEVLDPIQVLPAPGQGALAVECRSDRTDLIDLLGVLDDLENYAVIDNLAPRPGFPPICTIWGLKNKIVSPKAGRRLNSTLNPARQEWLPESGHLLMLEQPDEVASIIEEFLQTAATMSA